MRLEFPLLFVVVTYIYVEETKNGKVTPMPNITASVQVHAAEFAPDSLPSDI